MSSIRLVKFVPFASTGGETETIEAEQALQPNTAVCSFNRSSPVQCRFLYFNASSFRICNFRVPTRHCQVSTVYIDSSCCYMSGKEKKWEENADMGFHLSVGFLLKEFIVAQLLAVYACLGYIWTPHFNFLWEGNVLQQVKVNFVDKWGDHQEFINLHYIFLDCDCDSVYSCNFFIGINGAIGHVLCRIIYLSKPDGPTCHTRAETCYYTLAFNLLKEVQVKENELALTILHSLESAISQRQAELQGSQNEKPSWTKQLLLNNQLLCSKVREEADELCRTLEEKEDKSRTASEMADVLYHAMVLLRCRDVKVEDILEVLGKRFSKSGIEEKRSRSIST